ncbi:MAG: ABC transporter ATP-binding protein [Nitrospirae bacterium]|nr:ABC transporter ATP-binding protein [Nitrospirota bacterium]MBF0533992.1 ABC transporter ATP-binding protein [Nitrospirota bacterium]MBF0616151.1 ABC transporter ATP-binding protein [Nitrospirota bacterium]
MIETTDITKVYRMGDVDVAALSGISLTIKSGEFTFLMGPSGSGKTTAMNLLGCLDKPTSGKYFLDGVDVGTLNRDRLSKLRNEKIGFVFQGFNLLPRTTAVENVELPLLYMGIHQKERRNRAMAALERVGLSDRAHHQPNQLSGGQQQRVAIARALVNNARLILADEPTGNLDTKTSAEVLKLFTSLNEDSGITIVVVTHEPDIAAYGKRIIRFLDGRILSDESKN